MLRFIVLLFAIVVLSSFIIYIIDRIKIFKRLKYIAVGFMLIMSIISLIKINTVKEGFSDIANFLLFLMFFISFLSMLSTSIYLDNRFKKALKQQK